MPNQASSQLPHADLVMTVPVTQVVDLMARLLQGSSENVTFCPSSALPDDVWIFTKNPSYPGGQPSVMAMLMNGEVRGWPEQADAIHVSRGMLEQIRRAAAQVPNSPMEAAP